MSAPTSSETATRLDPLARHLRGLRESGRRLLVPYLTAGFPGPDDTPGLMEAIAGSGADVIELGVPFSDPLADGPTIQGSSQISLDQGGSLGGTLRALRTFRERGNETPVVVFTYLNPIFRYGVDRFLSEAADAGANGVLLTDLPLGSDPDLETRIESSPLSLVRLIAPTTPADRAAAIARRSQGFVYYISRTGVTGTRSEMRTELEAEVRRLRDAASVPVCVGFGISTPDQAREVAKAGDGVVVGSALIEVIRDSGADGAAAFLSGLREALDA